MAGVSGTPPDAPVQGDVSPTLRHSRLPASANLVLWALAAATATGLSYTIVDSDLQLPFFWFGAAVPMLWFAATPRQQRGANLVALGLLGLALGLLVGYDPFVALVTAVATPAKMVAYLWVMEHYAAHTWVGGGTARLRTLRDFTVLTLAIIAGSILECAIMAVLAATPGPPALSHVLIGEAGRAASMATLGTVGLLALEHVVLRTGSLRSELTRLRAQVTLARSLEYGCLALLTALAILAGAVIDSTVPATFLAMLGVLVVATRFSPLLSCTHAWATLAATVILGSHGHGPLAATSSPVGQILITQSYMLTLGMTALVVAVGHRERDATIARLRASEAAAESLAADLNLVLMSLKDGVAVVDRRRHTIRKNPALDAMAGVSLVGAGHARTPSDYGMFHLDGSPLTDDETPYRKVFAGAPESTLLVRQRRGTVDGPDRERVLEIHARRLVGQEHDEKPRAVITVRDVTQDYHERDAMASFAQFVAHDLRNPLTVVDAWAERLQDHVAAVADGIVEPLGSGLADEADLVAGRIRASVSRMNRFISDLLTYATTQDRGVSPEQVDLSALIHEIIATRTIMDSADSEITLPSGISVWADPLLVRELFDNLISNAVKYTAPGVVPQIRIDAEVAADWVTIDVADNGIGIPEADRVRVFEDFTRLHPEYAGTGLGLSICRHVVVAHGGSIQIVDPLDGVGTRIRFTLPASMGASAAATADSDSPRQDSPGHNDGPA